MSEKLTDEAQFHATLDKFSYVVCPERDTEYWTDNYILLDKDGHPLEEYDDDGEPLGLLGFITYHSFKPTTYHLTSLADHR